MVPITSAASLIAENTPASYVSENISGTFSLICLENSDAAQGSHDYEPLMTGGYRQWIESTFKYST